MNPDVLKQGAGPRLALLDSADPKSIAETLIAFANAEGGLLVVGISEDGKPADGKLDAEALEGALKKADALCSPTVVTGSWEEMTLDGGHAYSLRVPRSIELHSLTDGRVLIRGDAQNRPVGGQELLRLASAKTTGDFEATSLTGAAKEDFSKKMLEEYMAKRADRTKRPFSGSLDDLLKEIGAVDQTGKPTVAGLLQFTDYPQQWIPQSSVVFIKFLGRTPRGENGLAGYIRREELTGPLPRLIESAWNLVWSEMAVGGVVKGSNARTPTSTPSSPCAKRSSTPSATATTG